MTKTGVKFQDWVVARITHHDITSPFGQHNGSLTKPQLIVPTEKSLIVLPKPIVPMKRRVRRIEIHEISISCSPNGFREVSAPQHRGL